MPRALILRKRDRELLCLGGLFLGGLSLGRCFCCWLFSGHSMILLEGYGTTLVQENKEKSNLEDAGVLRGCGGDERELSFERSRTTTKSGGA